MYVLKEFRGRFFAKVVYLSRIFRMVVPEWIFNRIVVTNMHKSCFTWRRPGANPAHVGNIDADSGASVSFCKEVWLQTWQILPVWYGIYFSKLHNFAYNHKTCDKSVQWNTKRHISYYIYKNFTGVVHWPNLRQREKNKFKILKICIYYNSRYISDENKSSYWF